MKNICLYFQVHQPYRLRQISFFDITNNIPLFDQKLNKLQLDKAIKQCYKPANDLLLKLLETYPDFKITFGISGTLLDQLEAHSPEMLVNFQELVSTGKVEILAETENHSLAYFGQQALFSKQVKQHQLRIEKLFGLSPKVFRNTELIYSDKLGEWIHALGYQAVITEGVNRVLKDKKPHFLYHHPKHEDLNIFVKEQLLSCDIACRYSNPEWTGWPLTTKKFLNLIDQLPTSDCLVNIFMPYETFGIRQSQSSGIFTFLEMLPALVNKSSSIKFTTPTEALKNQVSKGELAIPVPVSWIDKHRDTSPWFGNYMQREAFDYLYAIGEKVKVTGSKQMEKIFDYLQTSDHFRYMSNRSGQMPHVHNINNPYDSPHDAFINYMNVLTNFNDRLDKFT